MDNKIQESLNKLNFNKVNFNVNKLNFGQVSESYNGEGLDLVVILDTSGSMNEVILGKMNVSKINASWLCLQEVLTRHLAGWGLSIMLFGGRGMQGWEWIAKPKDDIKNMQQPGAGGGTPLMEALKEAWFHAKSSERSRFIILTDGVPDGGEITKNKILKLAEENKNVVIDCVGVSGREYDPEFLKKLANITGGIFCEIKDTTQLWEAMKLLSPEVRKLPMPKKQLSEKVINL